MPYPSITFSDEAGDSFAHRIHGLEDLVVQITTMSGDTFDATVVGCVDPDDANALGYEIVYHPFFERYGTQTASTERISTEDVLDVLVY